MAQLDIGASGMGALVLSVRTVMALAEKNVLTIAERDGLLQATVGTFSGPLADQVRTAIKQVWPQANV